MSAKIHVLHPQAAPVAGFLRIGHTGHRKLEALHAAGRFPYRRVVFDAAHIAEQSDLLKLLKRSGMEIVLDPNFAEMATLGRYKGSISHLPWASTERPWSPPDFSPGRNLDVAKSIAEFAIKHGVQAVLAPAHFLEAINDPWRQIDLRMCERLRRELDQLGAKEIAIDYQLIITNALLRDEQARAAFAGDIGGLPIENVWLRTSGFGATATGAGTRAFVEVVRELHALDRPLIADCVGGFPGLAAGAFGAVGGISHGVGQQEICRASSWKRPANGKGGGSVTRTYIVELDRNFDENQLDAIFSAKFGKSRFGCTDTNCCHNGIEDTVENAHIHFITQRNRQLDDISSVPESRRSEHFLLRHMDPAVKSARFGSKMKIADAKVLELVVEAKARLLRLRDALADLQARETTATTRSRSPAFRGGNRSISAVLGI
jgi:hypothetical protein